MRHVANQSLNVTLSNLTGFLSVVVVDSAADIAASVNLFAVPASASPDTSFVAKRPTSL